jgi:hypothetical protein
MEHSENKAKVTPKDFFLWAGAMVSFYWSILAFIFLIFSYIDYAFPNTLQYYPANPYESGISTEMASIIVLLPLYLVLVRFITKNAQHDPSRKEIWVRRWALIFTLFIAGVAMAGDLIVLLTGFLSGEALTTAFLLKALIVLLVAAGVFMHFIADLKGYWVAYPMRRRYVSIAVGILAAASIIAGFFIVGTPMQARQARFDTQRVQDLQNIQSQVIYYYQAKQALPKTLDELNGAISLGTELPVDPQTNAAYEYQVMGARAFKLCATFNTSGSNEQSSSIGMRSIPAPHKVLGQDNWQHEAGEQCFDRTIDPAFYPPLNK